MHSKEVSRAHIVETRTEAQWSPRGTRMKEARPPADLDVIQRGHLCDCGHGEASHRVGVHPASEYGPARPWVLCSECGCSHFEHAECVYGSGCTPEDRCAADVHYDGRSVPTPSPVEEARGTTTLKDLAVSESAPARVGNGGWMVGDRVVHFPDHGAVVSFDEDGDPVVRFDDGGDVEAVFAVDLIREPAPQGLQPGDVVRDLGLLREGDVIEIDDPHPHHQARLRDHVEDDDEAGPHWTYDMLDVDGEPMGQTIWGDDEMRRLGARFVSRSPQEGGK